MAAAIGFQLVPMPVDCMIVCAAGVQRPQAKPRPFKRFSASHARIRGEAEVDPNAKPDCGSCMADVPGNLPAGQQEPSPTQIPAAPETSPEAEVYILLLAVYCSCDVLLFECMLLILAQDGLLSLQTTEAMVEEALSCPCVSDLKSGPCGTAFVAAFRCFHLSREVPKRGVCQQANEAFGQCLCQNPNEGPSEGIPQPSSVR